MHRLGTLLFCLLVVVCPAGTPADPASILLVQGTASTPNSVERRAAERVTQRLARWMDDLRIPYEQTTDDRIAGGIPRDVHLAILAYNPSLPADEQHAVQRFVERRGKLLVFYSADEHLARLMGLRLGRYRAAPSGAWWQAIRFDAAAPRHLPARVEQVSRNIRPVYPLGGDARVVAYWEPSASSPAASTNPPSPAVVQSEQGFWVTHILQDDGDTRRKKQMLLGLIAVHEPAVWRHSALQAIAGAGHVGRFGGVPDAIRSIAGRIHGESGEAHVRTLLDEAGMLQPELSRLFRAGQYPEVIEQAAVLDRILTHAYGAAHRPRPDEFRGVWDHSGTGLYPGDWPRTCRVLARHGMTDVLTNVLWPGAAHYRSGSVAQSDTFRLYGDQLRQCIAAAHEEGLRVHVWKICWNLDHASPDLVRELRAAGRCQASDTGRALDWLCPSDPRNQAMEIEAIRDVATHYAIDGIHLDYIRYPDRHACYCDGCRRRFEVYRRQPVADWPTAAAQGKLADAYTRWRIATISGFVRDLSRAVREANPAVHLSAAVYGDYPSSAGSVGQDWPAWLREGSLDFVCPMDYTEDLDRFTSLVRRQTMLPGTAGRLCPGIGVTARESRLDAFATIDQISALRRLGTEGFVLFDLDRTLESEILPVLRLGVTAD